MSELVNGSLAAHLAELARTLHAEDDPMAVLHLVISAALTEVPGADYAAVSIISRHAVSTPAYTNELAVKVDTAQYQTGQGPCLDAATDTHIVAAPDLDNDARWPDFAARAVTLGVRSMLSFQLFTDAGSVGALNLYARTPHAFTAEAEHPGAPLAAHAAVAMVATRTEANLRAALDTRDLIGQAKGILMERYKISPEQAFKFLLMASQNTNTKIRDVAHYLSHTGDLPDPTTGLPACGDTRSTPA